MPAKFRIIDTGVREGRANIAFDAALIDERQAGRVPDTIRFLSFPPTALIGRHQDLSREIDLEYCARHNVGTVRRITGGGAIYLDEGQLGWELVFHRSSLGIASLPDVAREICNAVAAGLQEFGVDAKFRPRNDIEVNGRKISGTGGFYDGDPVVLNLAVKIMFPEAADDPAREDQFFELIDRSIEAEDDRPLWWTEKSGYSGFFNRFDDVEPSALLSVNRDEGIEIDSGCIEVGRKQRAVFWLHPSDELPTRLRLDHARHSRRRPRTSMTS